MFFELVSLWRVVELSKVCIINMCIVYSMHIRELFVSWDRKKSPGAEEENTDSLLWLALAGRLYSFHGSILFGVLSFHSFDRVNNTLCNIIVLGCTLKILYHSSLRSFDIREDHTLYFSIVLWVGYAMARSYLTGSCREGGITIWMKYSNTR